MIFIYFWSLSLWLLAIQPSAGLDVSFYGESYMSVKLLDRSAYTRVMLQFMSQQENGTLLAAYGNIGFLLIELVRGELHVSLHTGAGAGTPLLVSRQKRLNDRQWHSVTFNKQGSELLLHVDSLTTNGLATAPYAELSIHSICLGGVPTGDPSLHSYLAAKATHFRGCLRHVKFNRYEIFNVTSNLLDSEAVAHKTGWSCAAEFQALPTDAFSFQRAAQGSSYAIFRPTSEFLADRFNVSFQLKTRSNRGVILFTSSDRVRAYFYMELTNYGLLRLVVKSLNSGSPVQMHFATRRFNDGRWHVINVALLERQILFTVDGFIERKYLDVDLAMQLKDFISFGGVSFYEEPFAHLLFPSRSGLAIEGCLRDIQLNSRLPLNFDNVQVTHNLKAKCQWPYPCTDDPCIPGAQCEELNRLDFVCRCAYNDERLCRKAPGTVETDHSEYFIVSTVNLREGGQVTLTERHIRFLFDFAQHGLEAGQVLFTVRTRPRRGRLQVNVENRREKDQFTLADLQQGRVVYIHDGSEEITDNAEIVVQLKAPLERLPPEFRYTEIDDAKGFDLNFYVAPENDRPIAKFPSGVRLGVLRNDRLLITRSHLTVQDGDNRPEELRWNVRYTTGTAGGHFVKRSVSRDPLFNFTHLDVQDRRIEFHNFGAPNVRVLISVSDGREASPEFSLEFEVIDLNITVLVNTGLWLSADSSGNITSRNLLAWCNLATQGAPIDLRYKLLTEPRVGHVFVCRSDGCLKVNSFTQSDVNASRVQFRVPIEASASTRDGFEFDICLLNGRCVSKRFTFEIHFILSAPTITPLVNRVLELYGPDETYLPVTKNHLRFAASVSAASGDLPSNIVRYIMQSTLRHGKLVRSLDQTALGVGSIFTQFDIDIRSIYYNYTASREETRNDSFSFTIEALQATSGPYYFSTIYRPTRSLAAGPRLINNGLAGITEGGRGVISSQKLSVQIPSAVGSSYSLVVVKRPRHGALHLINAREEIVQRDVTTISSQNLDDGLVIYEHDDSENANDWFEFEFRLGSSSPENEFWRTSSSFNGRFNISIQLMNDNAPIRVGRNVLQVATRQRRLVTQDVISFKDADTGSDPHEVVFHFVDEQMKLGYFLDSSRSVKITSFAQKQILMKQIYFVHSPIPSFGSVSQQALQFTVDDGKRRPGNETLIVNVSRPFVKLESDEFQASFGGPSVLTFSLLSNLDLEPRNMHFTVSAAPSHGQLLYQVDSRPLGSNITYQDIIDGKILYQHNGKTHETDHLSLRLAYSNEHLFIRESLVLRIVVTGEQKSLVVRRNQPLRVLQHSESPVSETSILIVSSKAPPNRVVYTVAQKPLYGRVVDSKETSVQQFSQQDLIDNRIRYKHDSLAIQMGSNRVTTDYVGLTVTDGYSSIADLRLQVSIVALKINLIVNRNLTGSLGSKLFIDSSDLQVNFDPPDHVTRLEMQRLKIFVTVPPVRGKIVRDEFADSADRGSIGLFNFDDLNSQKIVYLYHDDTTGWDQFEVVAQWDSIRSLPARVHVHMWAPFASMAPRVVVNRELRAFQDSPNPFGLEHLRAEDDDTPDRGLTYRVTAVQNCYVAFADNSMRRIDQFTQDDIAAGRMLFVHTGLSSFGSFNFYVQDSSGTQSQQYQFYATTQPLSIIMRSRLPSLEAFPNLMHILSPDHLLAVTNNGYYARDIVYRIKGNGALGRLGIVTRNPTTGAMTLEATREFTQSQVNASTVAYNHSHAYSLGSHAEYVDRVLFDVTARGAPSLERQELRIVISDRHINRFNQRLLLNMNPLTVLEGGNVSLTVRNIDGASFARLMPTNVLLFVITELPKYGIFTFSGNNISIGDTFVRDDLVKANLVYYHDGSDTEVDELGFYVREQTDSQLTPQSMAKQPAVLRIQVTPVNDQIFKVDRMNSVVKVLRGRFVKIGPDQLSVIDQDSQSEQIVYRVRRSPTFGQLRINSRACLSFPRAPEEPTCEFSQADVNAGQVVYLHLGNNGSLDSFYFCVSDSFSQPEHKPFCQTFEIHVSPVSITFLSTHDLLIRQGYNSATLTPVQLNASCNDPQDPIWYTVTRTPEYGQLYRDKLGVFNFSQADVDKGLIRYQLTRFVSSLDSMQFSVVTKSRSAVLPDRQLVIRVRAGVSVSPVILHECPGEMQTSRLTRNHIDDRELKNKLRYEAPTRYRIVKQAVNALISPASFTQSDIDAGAVQAVGLVGQRGRFLTPGVAAAEIEVTTPLANVAPGAFNLTVRLVLCQGQNASEARGKEFTNSEDDAARVLGLSRTNFVTLVLVCGVVLLAAVLLVLVRVIPQRLAKAAAANGRRQADSQVVEKPDTSQLYGSGSNGGSCNGGATLSSSSSRMQALPIVPESILKPKPLVSVASAGYYDTRSLASNHSHNASYRSIPGAKSASISNLSPGQQHLQAQLTPPPPPPPPPPPVQTISTATRHVAFDPHPRVENLSPPASLRQAGGGRSSKSSSPFRDKSLHRDDRIDSDSADSPQSAMLLGGATRLSGSPTRYQYQQQQPQLNQLQQPLLLFPRAAGSASIASSATPETEEEIQLHPMQPLRGDVHTKTWL